jgi:2-haloacid dehalogenase
MKSRPKVVAFDVVETLFSLEPMRERLRALGLPGEVLEIWFARLLRNAFALDASGTYQPLGEVARNTLEVLVSKCDRSADASALSQALAGFGELPAHADVAPAFQLLQEAGVRIVALTNGNADNTRRLLERALLGGHVERIISIDEVRRWKPAREVYLHAAKVADAAPGDMIYKPGHVTDLESGVVIHATVRPGDAADHDQTRCARVVGKYRHTERSRSGRAPGKARGRVVRRRRLLCPGSSGRVAAVRRAHGNR